MDGSDRQSGATSESPAFLVPRVGDVLDGKYNIEAVLGRGGMGIVFAARNQRTGRRVALKWMLPQPSRMRSSMQRFLREAEITGAIEHPNVISIYDVGFQHDSAFLVMECLSGEALSAWLQRRGALSIAETLSVLLPAMRGVEAAHAARVVHRDLKPANIFICRDGSADSIAGVKVLDFGISKVMDGSAMQALTQSGGFVGTLRYMCAEQMRGDRELDQRVDVYAFGVMLYESLTGRLPFESDNCFDLIHQIGSATTRPPRESRPDLPPELEAIIMKAMARDRSHRYPDMRGLIAALEPFDGTPAARAAARSIDAPRSEPRRASAFNRQPVTASAALALLTAGIAWSVAATSHPHIAADRPGLAMVAPPPPPSHATVVTVPEAASPTAESSAVAPDPASQEDALVQVPPRTGVSSGADRKAPLPTAHDLSIRSPPRRDGAKSLDAVARALSQRSVDSEPGAQAVNGDALPRDSATLSPEAKAHRLLQEVYGLSAQHRDAEALRKAQQAYDLHPTGQTLFQIASTETALGLYVEAYTDLRRVLKSDHPWVSQHLAQVQRDLAALDPHIVRLSLNVEPAGARIRVNGEERGIAPMPDVLAVAPGTIILDVRAAAFSDYTTTLQAQGGGALEHSVRLRLQSLGRANP